MRIVVVGSMNMDIVNQVERHPRPGETVPGRGLFYSPGGKGMNQAVAAALAGGAVQFVGAVGDDSFGEALWQALTERGLSTDFLIRKAGSTGLAFITVDQQGENSIILAAGANGAIREADLQPVLERAGAFDLLLVQNEIPLPATVWAMRSAKQIGARVVFNPAPVAELADELYPLVDVLVLNETEAEVLTGQQVSDRDTAMQAAASLLGKGVQSVILTLGEKGAYFLAQGAECLYTPAFSVQAVDTTAAGDTFIGAWAAAIAEGQAMPATLSFAAAAAALAVTRRGAQEAIPQRAEIERFLQQRAGETKGALADA